MTNQSDEPSIPGDIESLTQSPTFTPEFKKAAVRRLYDGKQSATALAAELGIRRNLLYKWATALARNGGEFASRGRKPAAQESETVRLRRELAKAQEELAILKKFQAYLKRAKR